MKYMYICTVTLFLRTSWANRESNMPSDDVRANRESKMPSDDVLHAVAHFQQAVVNDPLDSRAQHNLAAAYERAGQAAAAVRVPFSPDMRMTLIRAYNGNLHRRTARPSH